MYNFCSSLSIYLKFKPGITHLKTFEWMQYFGRRLRAGLRLILISPQNGILQTWDQYPKISFPPYSCTKNEIMVKSKNHQLKFEQPHLFPETYCSGKVFRINFWVKQVLVVSEENIDKFNYLKIFLRIRYKIQACIINQLLFQNFILFDEAFAPEISKFCRYFERINVDLSSQGIFTTVVNLIFEMIYSKIKVIK